MATTAGAGWKGECAFDRIVVRLRLDRYEGEELVSRAQATRVTHRFERCRHVERDLSGISDIGQAFADEIFRVFAAAHPGTRITPVNTAPAVDHMIRRALAAGATRSRPASDA